MAIGGTSYSDWMRQNPQLVQQAQENYAAPATTTAVQESPKPVQPQQQEAPAAPAAQPVPAQQAAPVQQPKPAQVGSGAEGATATTPKDQGNEGAINMAKTIASFWTGGAASGIMGGIGGEKDRRVESTMEPGAKQQASGGGGLGQALGLVSMFKGGKGGGK